MVKKTRLENETSGDDSTLDKELDIPSLDFDLDPPPDDRSPAKKILDASVDQVKNTATSGDFIGKFLRKALPDTYGEVFETVAGVGTGTKELYNSAVKEIKPALNDLARATDKLVPETSKKTKSAVDRIKKWSDSNTGYSAASSIDTREAGLGIEIADIFKFQMLEQQKLKAETDASQRVHDSLDIMRHRQDLGALSNIGSNISRMTQYQERVTAAFQKKSLELQYRSYFVSTDALTEAKRANEVQKTVLEGILKNTALPEFVKIRGSERLKEIARTKAMETLIGGTGDFIKKMFGNVKGVVGDTVNNIKDTFSTAAMMTDMVGSGKDMGGRSDGIGGLGAGIAVDSVMKHYAGKAGDKAREFLDKNEKFSSATESLRGAYQNAPALITNFANNENIEDNNVMALLRQGVKAILPGQNADLSLQTDNASAMRDHALFTNQTNKSITEIIPGFLARIFREIQVLRTGDDSTQLTTYDYMSNKFTDKKTLINKIKSNLFSDSAMEYKNTKQNDLLNKIDPENKLDKETREALMDKLVKDLMSNKLIDYSTLTNKDTYKGNETLSKSSDAITELMEQYFTQGGKETDKNKSTFKRRNNNFGSSIKDIATSISNPASQLQELINLGLYEEVRGTGLFEDSESKGIGKNVMNLLSKYPEAADLVKKGDYKAAAEYINEQQGKESKGLSGFLKSGFTTISANDLKPKETSDRISYDSIVANFKKTDENSPIYDKVKTDESIARQTTVQPMSQTALPRAEENKTKDTDVQNKIVQSSSSLSLDEFKAVVEKVLKSSEVTSENILKINTSVSAIREIMSGQSKEDKDSSVQEIITAIKDTTSSSDNTLKEILNKLKNMNFTNNTDQLVGGVRGIFSNLFGLAGNARDFAKHGIKLGSGVAKDMLGRTKATAQIAGKIAKGVTTQAANILIKKRDVFVNSELKPRLTASGFKAGEYFDSVTGKVLKTIGDLKNIKGDIKDKNGDTVLYLEEVKDTFVKAFTGTVESVVNIGKWVGSTASRLLSGGVSMSTSLIGSSFRMAGKIKSMITNIIDGPIDVYLKDKLDKPILLAIIMKNGGYVSVGSGKVITKPSEIDGPLKTLDGNYALTEEQLKEGIVDKDNKPITNALGKLARFGIGIAATGLRTVLKVGALIGKGISKGTEFSMDLLKGFGNTFRDLFNFGMGGKKSLTVLEEIRDVLKERLPGAKKRKFGDKDGDGDRDGGWQDLFQNKKESDEKDEYKDNTIKPDRKNTIDKMLDGLASMKDKIAGLFGLGENGSGPGIDIDLPDSDGRNRPNGKDGKPNTTGKKQGLFRRGLGKIGNVASGAGRFAANNAGTLLKGAGIAGTAYAGYSAVDNISKGQYGDAAVDAGMAGLGVAATTGGLGALGSGALAAGGGILGAAGTAAAAIGGVISAPVVLAGAALALTAYGGYRLYKAMKKLKPFQALRMAQYGLSKENMSEISMVEDLEKILMKQIRYDQNTTAELDDSGLDYKAIADIFGLKTESKERAEIIRMRNWQTWFVRRFKPVFLTHLTALRKLEGKHTFESIDSTEDFDIKNKYLNVVRFPEGNYSLDASPFEDLPKLVVFKPQVQFYIRQIEEEIAKGLEDKKKPSLMQAFKDGKLGETLKSRYDDFKKDNVFTRAKDSISNLLQGLTLDKVVSAIPVIGEVYKASKFVGNTLARSLGFGVSALEAVRFKGYGLVEMDRSKVMTLRSLETEIEKGITFQTNNTATWDGSIQAVIKEIGGDFGVSSDNAEKVKIWSTWFATRFLPVFTTYLSALRSITNKGDRKLAEVALKSQDRLLVGKQIISTDVWGKSVSPWQNYTLNTDSKTTQPNMNILESEAKDAVLKEQKTDQAKKVVANKAAGAAQVAAVAKIDDTTKGAYTDRRSEQQVQDSKVNNIMAATYGKHWRESLSDKDKADAVAGMKVKLEKEEIDKQDALNKVKDVVPGRKDVKRGNFNGFGPEVDTYIREASEKYGIDEKQLRGFVKMEAGWTGKMSPTGAIGTGQFIQSTWNDLAKTKDGQEIGMKPITRENFRTDQDPRHDKRINTLATALLAKQNAAQLKKAGLEPTGENLYMMHNVGPGVINALKGGEVGAATMKAMGHNGLKSGMTAVDFVSRQKDIFNSHYASANAVSPSIDNKLIDKDGKWNDFADKSKLNPVDSNKGIYANVASNTTREASEPLAKTNPVTTANLGEDKFKPNTVVAQAPQSPKSIMSAFGKPGIQTVAFQTNDVPKAAPVQTNSTIAQVVQRTPEVSGLTVKKINSEVTIQDTRKEFRDTLGPLNKTAEESLTVQKQMLGVLSTISGQISLENLHKVLKASIPSTQNNQPPQDVMVENNIQKPRDKSRTLPTLPVNMGKTNYGMM